MNCSWAEAGHNQLEKEEQFQLQGPEDMELSESCALQPHSTAQPVAEATIVVELQVRYTQYVFMGRKPFLSFRFISGDWFHTSLQTQRSEDRSLSLHGASSTTKPQKKMEWQILKSILCPFDRYRWTILLNRFICLQCNLVWMT